MSIRSLEELVGWSGGRGFRGVLLCLGFRVSVNFPKQTTSAAGGILLHVTTAEHGGSGEGSEVMVERFEEGLTDVVQRFTEFHARQTGFLLAS
ncbi:hypothetical protein L1887_14710 [Cichorium endivia]|nr:hypothetical protein L1887_14710 [Cichorium endivia]